MERWSESGKEAEARIGRNLKGYTGGAQERDVGGMIIRTRVFIAVYINT